MKYTSILAGVLGLMALAACNDNDEVTIEQPKGVQTLTVTWGGGADTRLSMSNTTEGLKSSWEAGDEIIVVPEKSGDSFTYKTVGSGQTAVFNLEGETGPVDGKYFIYYPSTFLTGLDLSNQTGLLEDQKNYIVAACRVFFKDGVLVGEVTLQPQTSYLYIPAGTVFPDLKNFDGEFSLASITFSANDLIVGANAEGPIKGNITIDAGTTALFLETSDAVKTADDIYIAVPVDVDPITSLSLMVNIPNSSSGTNVEYNLIKATDSSPASISEKGRVYKILSGNLQLVTV